MIPSLASDLAVAVAMAVAAGLVGCFAVMRRMTLASDAISHVALPGIGLAIAFRISPLVGGLAALLGGILLIWLLERTTRVPTEALIGVVFSAALAVGSMLTSGEELLEALFGTPAAITPAEIAGGLLGAGLVSGYILRARHRLVIALVSSDLARTTGINVGRENLLYLLAFALAVALGLRYLGVLLMGSLVIIPAATAKHLSRCLTAMLVVATGTAVFATVVGVLGAHALGTDRGPLIIVICAGVFFTSLLFRRRQ